MEEAISGQSKTRKRMSASGHLVVETNDKQYEIKQEEEFNDDDVKVVLTYLDYERVRRCAVSGITSNSERSNHQGVLRSKFKVKYRYAYFW